MEEKEILTFAKTLSSIYYEFKGREHIVDTALDGAFIELRSLNVFSNQEKKMDLLEKINLLCILKGALHGADKGVRGKEALFKKLNVNPILREV